MPNFMVSNFPTLLYSHDDKDSRDTQRMKEHMENSLLPTYYPKSAEVVSQSICTADRNVAQHKAQHTGDVSHLCSKEKTLGVEILCVCTSEDERRGCVFTTLPIGGFIFSMTHPCPFA